MSLTISNSVSTASLQDILAQAETAAGDVRKDAKIARKMYHDKNIRLFDKNIGALKKQQSQLGKAGWFNFVVGMVSNFLNIATAVLSAIFPPLAPVFMAVNAAMQGALQAVSHINPFAKKAGAAGIKAQEFQKLAEKEQFRGSMEDERIKAMVESGHIFKNRMEKTIENLQKSQEAAVRA